MSRVIAAEACPAYAAPPSRSRLVPTDIEIVRLLGPPFEIPPHIGEVGAELFNAPVHLGRLFLGGVPDRRTGADFGGGGEFIVDSHVDGGADAVPFRMA